MDFLSFGFLRTNLQKAFFCKHHLDNIIYYWSPFNKVGEYMPSIEPPDDLYNVDLHYLVRVPSSSVNMGLAQLLLSSSFRSARFLRKGAGT